jgi:hypothetical protein
VGELTRASAADVAEGAVGQSRRKSPTRGPRAITNADLSFQTRRTAEQAPEKARAAIRVDLAVGMLVEAQAVDGATARELLEEAAQRAGLAVEELAVSLVDSRQDADGT